jgi:hypothetical protein
MRQKLNLTAIYADALEALPEKLDGLAPPPVPRTCPVTLEEVLAPTPARDAAEAP